MEQGLADDPASGQGTGPRRRGGRRYIGIHRFPDCRKVHLRRRQKMSEVLLVAEHVDSHVSKPALELLTLARRLGEPVAVVFGDTSEAIAKELGEYGAARVLTVTDPAMDDYLVAPQAEALAQIAQTMQPVAILITSTPEGKEIAGWLAVKLGSGLITD